MPYKSPLKIPHGTTFSLAVEWNWRRKEQLQAGLSHHTTEKYWFAMTKHWIFRQSAKKTILWVLKYRPHRHLNETSGNLLLRGLPPWVWRGSFLQDYFVAIGSTSIFKRKQVHCGRDNSEFWGTRMLRGTKQHRHVQSACALCGTLKDRWRKNPELFKVHWACCACSSHFEKLLTQIRCSCTHINYAELLQTSFCSHSDSVSCDTEKTTPTQNQLCCIILQSKCSHQLFSNLTFIKLSKDSDWIWLL